MPRKTKDDEQKETKKRVTSQTTKKSTNSTAKKTTSTKKSAGSTAKKATNTKKSANSITKKATSTKKSASSTTKKATNSTTKKTIKKKKNNLRTIKKVNSNLTLQKVEKIVKNYEYYDLPYRYNETTVKLLAQTPSKLFVYWDISDEDRNNYIEKYGENFFNETTPILLIYNDTKGYYFKLTINDFANSWYITVPHDNCKYRIKLAREYKTQEQNYIQIAISNQLEAPNGHLLNKFIKKAKFRNVKTNITFDKEVFSNILNIYNEISDVFALDNPSSNFARY